MTAEIVLANKFARLSLPDEGLLKKVQQLLSYQEPSIQFRQAYRNGYGWNGINYLMNKKGEFPIGLVGMVKEFLAGQEIPFAITDQRSVVERAEPINIEERLSELKMVPRYYQVDAVKEAIKHRQGIIKACTGAGKSLCMAMLTAELNKPTTIFVIGLDLLQQMHDLFSKIFDEQIGYVGNGVCQVERINIVSLWTAARALGMKTKILDDDEMDKEDYNENDSVKIQQLLKSSKVLAIDECHVSSTESVKKLYKAINPEYLYGFSGTPHKDDETDIVIRGYLGEVIVNISASELIDRGYLIKPTIKFFQVPKQYFPDDTYPGVYKGYIIENTQRNQMVVDSAQRLVEAGYQTLVLFRYLNHGQKLFEMLEERGVECAILNGKDKLEKREEIKQRLLNGELQCVLASVVYDCGVDIASLNGLVLAGGGKSSVRTLQRIGRVIRISPSTNKEDVKVVDFVDNAKYLKGHSKRRAKIYRQEKGFEVILPKGLKL